jgi:hypothetical protein
MKKDIKINIRELTGIVNYYISFIFILIVKADTNVPLLSTSVLLLIHQNHQIQMAKIVTMENLHKVQRKRTIRKMTIDQKKES